MSNVLLTTPMPNGSQSVSYFLHPGHLFASKRPSRVTTILGSCVSVCLYDAERQIGGINHFILPATEEQAPYDYLRFGNHAVPALIRALVRHGGKANALAAKVFGGAALMRSATGRSIGGDNVVTAVRALSHFSIPVIAEDVGGSTGRKLVFDTGNGAAFVKRL